jgi:hypothetical protein
VSRSWLSGFGSPSTPDQRCSGTEFKVDVTGADAGDLEPCLLRAGNGLHLQVHNRTGVPITISGPDIVLWTVHPNSTVDILLKGNPVNQSFTFKPNVAAGVSMALLDKFGEGPVPEALQWANCFLQPDTRCLADLVIPHLPRETEIGNVYVPVQWIHPAPDRPDPAGTHLRRVRPGRRSRCRPGGW